MSLKNILYFLLGMLLGAVSFAALFILFQLLIFNLAGGETLTVVRTQRGVLLALVILLAFIFVRLAIRWVRSVNNAKGYGLALVTLAAIVISAGYFIDLYCYKEFDRNAWSHSQVKPFRMAAGLVAQEKLSGMTKAQIREMLGYGTEKWEYLGTESSVMTYELTSDWTMFLFLEKDKLSGIEIRRPSMMT